jgi:hypothetical protein
VEVKGAGEEREGKPGQPLIFVHCTRRRARYIVTAVTACFAFSSLHKEKGKGETKRTSTAGLGFGV